MTTTERNLELAVTFFETVVMETGRSVGVACDLAPRSLVPSHTSRRLEVRLLVTNEFFLGCAESASQKNQTTNQITAA